MMYIFDSIKFRIIAIIIASVILTHFIGLWLYLVRSKESNELIQDALVAERIALVVRLIEAGSVSDVHRVTEAAGIQFAEQIEIAEQPSSLNPTDNQRLHLIGHLLGALLNRPKDEGIRLAIEERISADIEVGSVVANISDHFEFHHRSRKLASRMQRDGTLRAEIHLQSGAWLKMATPIVTASALLSMDAIVGLFVEVAATVLVAVWAALRWTQPLSRFAAAAEELGANLNAEPVPETGLSEVRQSARAFNNMRESIRRLVGERTAMAAAIAHDLGTPITRLRLRVEELDGSPERGKMLADLEQMRRMVSGTLEFARATFHDGKPERFDLASLLQSVCDDFADGGAQVEYRGPPHVVVTTEPAFLRRALSNLIDNAVKYGGSVTVGMTKVHDRVDIHIEDSGNGIPAHLHEEAMRPFSRLSASDQAVDGTGLGLSIASSIASNLGGHIAFENIPAGGFRATLSLRTK